MTVDDHGVLGDRYALDEVIARGGMADVYRATDQLLLRPVAVKLLRQVTDPSQRARFEAEARTLASLNHPGLVTLLDAGILDDRPYLVLELASGPTLAARIAEGALEPAEVRRIGHELAKALAYAHGHGVVHRDVKPSNVLLADDDRVLLADFGIARLMGEAEHYTKSGDTIGSPAYLAPEQVSAEPISPAADVYSLGLVLLEALTSARAYSGSPVEAAVARLHAGPAVPTHLDPGWRSLITRMTQRDPADRPTASEVALELVDPASTSTGTGLAERALVDTGELERTGELRLPEPSEPGDDGSLAGGDPAQVVVTEDASPSSRRRVLVASMLSLLLIAALAGVLVAAPWKSAQETDPDPVIPAGVPTRLQQPLSDLHDAVEGHHR